MLQYQSIYFVQKSAHTFNTQAQAHITYTDRYTTQVDVHTFISIAQTCRECQVPSGWSELYREQSSP